MKKYYCPYCGELTRKWYHKLSSRATNIVAHNQKHCNVCGHYIPVRQRFNVWFIFALEIFSFLASVYLFVSGKTTLGYISFFAYMVLFFIHSVLEVALGKFVKYDDDAKDDKYYKCFIELTDNVKFPKLYFYGTSVVQLFFEKTDVPIPVCIEPLEINSRNSKCKIAFLFEKPTEEFMSKTFTLIDNDKTVGNGHFDK